MTFSELKIGDIFTCPPSDLASLFFLGKEKFIKSKPYSHPRRLSTSSLHLRPQALRIFEGHNNIEYSWIIPDETEVIKLSD